MLKTRPSTTTHTVMMTELFSKNMLSKILASIPIQFDKHLIVRNGEPNTLQLLKLSIRALFNNILRCPYLEIHGNDKLKALWLLQNIECSKNIFRQYNYLDYYPYIDSSGDDYDQPFITSQIRPLDPIGQWNIIYLMLTNVIAANRSLKNAMQEQKYELLERLHLIGQTEETLILNSQKMSADLLFRMGEYNSTLDRFIDIFLPINRDDHIEAREQKELNRKSHNNIPLHTDESICMLQKTQDGNSILTIVPDLDKDARWRFSA